MLVYITEMYNWLRNLIIRILKAVHLLRHLCVGWKAVVRWLTISGLRRLVVFWPTAVRDNQWTTENSGLDNKMRFLRDDRRQFSNGQSVRCQQTISTNGQLTMYLVVLPKAVFPMRRRDGWGGGIQNSIPDAVYFRGSDLQIPPRSSRGDLMIGVICLLRKFSHGERDLTIRILQMS